MSLTITYTAKSIVLTYTDAIIQITADQIKLLKKRGDYVFIERSQGHRNLDILYSDVTSPVYATGAALFNALSLWLSQASGNIAPVLEYSTEDTADGTTTRYIVDINDDGWDKIGCHYKLVATGATETVTMTVWGSNNADADNTADTNWVDLTQLLTGASSIACNNTTIESMFLRSTDFPISRLMFKFVFAGTPASEDNSVDLYILRTQ